MIEALSLLLILFLIIASIKSRVYGFCLFLYIRILIPESVRFLNTSVSLNTVVIFVLFLMTVFLGSGVHGKFKYNKKLMLGILTYIAFTFIALLLSDYKDLSAQMGYLLQFIITDIMPIILCVMIVKSENDINIVCKNYLIICIIVGIYGIISYFLDYNPYLLFWSGTNEVNNIEQWYGNATASTFVSTNAFGYFIGLSVPFIVYIFYKGLYKNYSKTALFLLIICSFICKKRTIIVVLFFYATLLFLTSNFKSKRKYIMYGLPIIVLSLVTIFFVPSLESVKNVVISSLLFWDDSIYSSATMGNGGSNWLLRTRQFVYPFIEIKNNYIFGHGFGWCSVYLADGKIHPVLYGFETIVSQLICEYGLLSLVVFPLIFRKLYTFVNKNTNNKYVLLFLVASIVQMIGTGAIYWYLELTILMLMKVASDKIITQGVNNESQNINCITNI